MAADRIGLVSGLFLTLMLGACSGEGPSLSAGVTPTSPAQQVGLNLSPEEVAQSGPIAPFNPFADPSATTTGGREVIAQPTMAEILEPVPGLPEMAFGQADAPVTIVQYASLSCPHCKRFHAEVYPILKRDYIDTGKVRYVLRDFPIGKTSGQASVALRCVAPERYLDLYGKFQAQQTSWVSQEVRIDPIAAVAAQVGLSRADYDACRANTALIESLKGMKDRGRKLGIIGTPNFFVQDKLIKKAIDMAELRAMIDPLVAARTASAAPGKP
jgi:protein-disulfide isomerase